LANFFTGDAANFWTVWNTLAPDFLRGDDGMDGGRPRHDPFLFIELIIV
jgi:hypothetical protein